MFKSQGDGNTLSVTLFPAVAPVEVTSSPGKAESCRRQHIEMCSADQSAQSMEKIFHFHCYQDVLLWHLRASHCKYVLLN